MSKYLRMFYAEYEQPGGVGDYYLTTVTFPMQVEVDVEDSSDTMMLVETEEEFVQWANERFVYFDLWSMELPENGMQEAAGAAYRKG